MEYNFNTFGHHLGSSLSLHGELEGHGGAHGLPQHVQLCGLHVLLVGRLAGHQRVVGELRVHPSVDTRPREVKSSMLSRMFKVQPPCKELWLSKLALRLNIGILLHIHIDGQKFFRSGIFWTH